MMLASEVTMIRGGWIVGFDGESHRIIRDGVVVVRGDVIEYVGQDWQGDAGREIDARQDLVIPGLINTHSHVGAHAGDRMVFDGGRRDLFRSGFLNYCTTKGANGPTIHDYEKPEAGIRFSLASILKCGATTVVDMGAELGGGSMDDGMGPMAQTAGELGIRLYTSPGFSSAHHYFDQGGRHRMQWDEEAGLRGLERAVEYIRNFDGAFDGRIRGILVPLEYHTATHDLLRRTKEAARELGVGITTHCAESIVEVQDSIRETGRTPVSMLYDLGFLGPEVVLGHTLYTAGHSQIAFPYGDDLAKLAETGATVAHCPLVFARRGLFLESFQRYHDAGVNVSIGTDSYPQDILGELKFVGLMGKVAEHNQEHASTRDIFNAVTLSAARALNRPDLGRLAAGAQADVVICDFHRLRTGPFLDPIKTLIQCCDGEVVKHVMVQGRVLIEDGNLIGWDEDALLEDVRQSTDRAWDRFAEYWPESEPIAEVFPAAFETWDGG
jgi:cytosine/adenosine deaminase-related metal-dependent hydrolase